MKKTLLVIPVVVLLASLVLAVTAFAGCEPPPCPTPTPPPCDEPADCSPGFWKNHTELWQEWAGDDFDWMIAGLRAKGWEENRGDRWVATDILNAAFPNAPCD